MNTNAKPRLMDTETSRMCLTTSQAAKRSELSSVYLTQLLRKGTVEGFKLGREWFTYADSLDQFLSRDRKSGPKGPYKSEDKDEQASQVS